MTFQFEMTLKDFHAAHSLATSTHPAAKAQRIARKTLPAFGAILVVAYLSSAILGNQATEVSLRPCAILGAWFLSVPLFVRYGQKQAFNRSFPEKNSPRTITVTLDEAGVRWGIPGVAESQYGWSAVKSLAEDKSVALIYVGQANFLTLPKRVFDEQQLGQIRLLFVENAIKITKG